MPLLQAALNGDREHPAAPRTPAQLAAEGRAAVHAGAGVLHLHPYDESGRQTFEAEPCAAALRAVRAACPGIPISLSTSADIEPDPERRLALVAAWTDLPELVTANQGEPGIAELCELLIERGIGIEAGLLSLADARHLHRFRHRGPLRPRDDRAARRGPRGRRGSGGRHGGHARRPPACNSSRFTTAKASRPGPSTGGPPRADTASGPGSRTPRCCPTGARHRATASSWPPRRRCSRSSRRPSPRARGAPRATCRRS